MTHVVFRGHAMCGAGKIGAFEGDAVNLASHAYARLRKMVDCYVCLQRSEELKLFQIAQEITDEAFGAGYYVKQNGFDPSIGQVRYARDVL